jgi:methionyl-tRNA formyltransferase
MKVHMPPVKEVAIAHNIPVFQPKKIREEENIEYLKRFKADIMVVIAFGQILPKEILEMTRLGCINVHASLLPAWRGAAPIQWSIMAGDKETGITTMQMDVGLDTGDMLLKKVIPIANEETGGSLHDKLAVAGGELLVETLEKLEKNEITPIKQTDTTTPYASQLNKKMGQIDWNEDVSVIERKIRALNPWPSAYTHINGKMLKIWEAKAILDTKVDGEVGSIFAINKDSFEVICTNGILKVLKVQLEGKKSMMANDFLRGNKLEIGMKLG